jgi:N-acetylated-alpha-linked acidic dipeptidase
MPHLAGSVEDYKLAKFTLERFAESFPNSSFLDPHDVLLTYPLASSITMSSPVQYDCVIREPVIPVDPTSGDSRIVEPFNGYSPTGTVTSPLVYVNYGRPEDYRALPQNASVVKGKIGEKKN